MKILLPIKLSCHMQESAREFCYPSWLLGVVGCLGTFIGSQEVNSQSYLSQNIQARYSLNTYFTFLGLLKETEMSACKTICLCSTLKEVSNKIVKEWPILVVSLGNFGLHTKKKKVLYKIPWNSSHDLSLCSFLSPVSTECSCKVFLSHTSCSPQKKHYDTFFSVKLVPFSQGDLNSGWRMGCSYLH